MGAFSPYFGPFLDSRGYSAAQIAIVMGLWYGTRIFAPNLWAALVARHGAPIRWLRWGSVATLVACAGFLPNAGIVATLAAMLVFASLYNALMPQFEAITLAHLGAARQQYGRIRLWGSIGFLLVVLGGGALFREVGYGWLIALLLPLFALTVFAAWQVEAPPEVASSAPSGPAPASAGALTILKQPAVSALLGVAFLNQIAHGPMYVYLSIYLGQHGHGPATVGTLWALGVLAEIALFWAMPRLLGRYDPVHLLVFALSIGALRWTLMAAAPASLPLMALAQLGHACTFAVAHAATMQLLARSFDARHMAFGQAAMYGLSSGVGGVIGALLAGLVWTQLSGPASFAMAGAISLAALGLLPWLRRPRPER
ncbi:MAG: MFS transporter [Xanthomonadales bacterium]|nr:MFS transporter [Xanthomonadales bacterium]